MALTIRDIAKMSGVSVTTVSQILNNKGHRFSKETKGKVLSVVKENEYTPNYFASNIIKKKSKLIGVVMPSMNEPLAYSIVRNMREFLGQEDYHLLISESYGKKEQEVELLSQYNQLSVEAILLISTHEFTKEVINQGHYRETPVIFLDYGKKDHFFGTVVLGEYKGIYGGVTYLINKGHQKIGFIKYEGKEYSLPERKKAYEDALTTNQLPVDPNLVKKTELSVQAGYQATIELLRESSVTAIFCCDDNVPIGCYQAIIDEGKRINADIEVIGYDGVSFLSEIRPSIKMLKTPFKEIARALSKKLIQAINYPHTKQNNHYLEMSFLEK
ncbi:LacI family DNA-binding transcriptional regulator [Vagococcus carniphilus]|uniref:LacI family DNA-binding transcriptional regulator n=1 Tax=Vagococcus carniphilus TaxID=218144 RepID=UPI00288F8C1F|nr:LacI family DNA-binding transcriptional regulator [Vagococcus carniphilus]MDT2815176.1 LacI family DNA-binding transcriptional regulator [Vagococcus carniphilus]MDT2866083.1 LacI family DNA-binding transcriptional regulator [Vagococcus carniphilus]